MNDDINLLSLIATKIDAVWRRIYRRASDTLTMGEVRTVPLEPASGRQPQAATRTAARRPQAVRS